MHRRDFLKALVVTTLPMPAIAQSAKPKTIRIIKNQNLGSIDPIWTTAAATQDFSFMVFDVIVGVDENYIPKPQMAESWSIEDDGRNYIFKLRPGLKFHDGQPVTTRDVIPSLKRMFARDDQNQIFANLVEKLDRTDDRSFTLRLKEPFGR